MGGSIVIGKPTGSQNGKPVARESLADVIVRASGGRVERAISDFTIGPNNGSISIRLIGIVTRWKKGEGFRELKPDGTPDERAVDKRVVIAFKSRDSTGLRPVVTEVMPSTVESLSVKKQATGL